MQELGIMAASSPSSSMLPALRPYRGLPNVLDGQWRLLIAGSTCFLTKPLDLRPPQSTRWAATSKAAALSGILTERLTFYAFSIGFAFIDLEAWMPDLHSASRHCRPSMTKSGLPMQAADLDDWRRPKCNRSC
jgi:hypothetical protein